VYLLQYLTKFRRTNNVLNCLGHPVHKYEVRESVIYVFVIKIVHIRKN